jgi:hypothetical protein
MKISQLFAIPLVTAIAVPFAIQSSVETAIAQSQTSLTRVIVAQQSTDSNLAKTLYEAYTEIEQRPCDGYRKTITQKSNRFTVCATRIGGGRVNPATFISSASAGNLNGGGGITYHYHYNGKVAAIAFSQDGKLFMFDRSGKLQAELIRDQARSIRSTFTKAERDRLEKLAKGGGEEILSKFK